MSRIEHRAAPLQLPSPLPPLREDLRLQPAAPHVDGSPAWTIQDPVVNTFYRIGWLELELLTRWHLGDPERILTCTAQETVLTPMAEELAAVFRFLSGHHLLAEHAPETTGSLVAEHRARRPGPLRWLLHNYLFFRIPLIRPGRLLHNILPWVAWIFSPPALALLAGLTCLGLLLTFRQWDLFVASLAATANPSGMVGYLLALTFVKSLHELGHALTATRYGLHVAHMGVAFLVLWPVLYTDTGEAWRLRERRQRVHIVAAGIVCELLLGGLALLAWNLTSEGDLRRIFLFMGTTAWVLSLLLNLSPFMRYDGYFLLSDLLDLPNLHERSSALARTALRRCLLGWDEPFPESLPRLKRLGLTAFAFITWCYRFLVYLGIAAAVYHYCFKLLGVLLFLMEITWFVIRPIRRELSLWYARRATIRGNRKVIAVLCLLGLIGLGCIPWRQQIQASGWAHPHQTQVFYSPLSAQLLHLPQKGGKVAAGTLLFTLSRPEIEQSAALAGVASATLQQQLDALVGIDQGEMFRATLSQQKRLYDVQVQGGRIEAERLHIRAPFTGVLTDIDPTLARGSWVSPQVPLAVLVDPTAWVAEVYVRQAELSGLRIGEKVLFYPEGDALNPLAGVVTKVDAERMHHLPHVMLERPQSRLVAATLESNGQLVPRDVCYRVHVRLEGGPDTPRILRGQAIIAGQARTSGGRLLTPLIHLVIREMYF